MLKYPIKKALQPMITSEQRADIEYNLHIQMEIDGPYEIDDQGRVSVDGSVQRRNEMMTQLKVNFLSVSGNFKMDRCALRTLEGFPQTVSGHVSIAHTNVRSLKGSPEFVGGHFWAYGCRLKNLLGAPQKVRGKFAVYNNDLTSYEHMPQECQELELPYNPQLGVLQLLEYPKIQFFATANSSNKSQATLLTNIVSKYAGTNNPGDILRCASELNEHGLEGNAEW